MNKPPPPQSPSQVGALTPASSMDPTSSSSTTKPRTPSRSCLCSPTTHPGSFRCKLHRSAGKHRSAAHSASVESQGAAKANSMRALLIQIIRPTGQELCRRRNFVPRPSRFCLIDGNGQGVAAVWWSFFVLGDFEFNFSWSQSYIYNRSYVCRPRKFMHAKYILMGI